MGLNETAGRQLFFHDLYQKLSWMSIFLQRTQILRRVHAESVGSLLTAGPLAIGRCKAKLAGTSSMVDSLVNGQFVLTYFGVYLVS